MSDGRSLDDVAVALAELLPGRVERNAASAPLTTYRCGGPVGVLVRVEREDDIAAVAGVIGRDDALPVLVVGRGSNLLVGDGGFAGVVLLTGGDLERVDVDATNARVTAGAAAALPVLARQAAKAGVGGLEFFVGIPGSVGGAVRMNAGGHGAQTLDVLVGARVADLRAATVGDRPAADLGLGYRTSALGAREVVVAATFAGRADDPQECERRIDEIVRWRREHQPGGQNAGSVFVNPPGDAAGRLIDACGLKGTRIGGAVVSPKHANFFVAEPGAKAADVIALVRLVQARVEERTGVRLEPELQIVANGGSEEATR